MTTIAGTGAAGSMGDGDLATSAQLNFGFNAGVTVDGSGSVFIADSGNRKIRMVSTTGIITTVGGTGTWGSSGDNVPAISAEIVGFGVTVDSSGRIFIAEGGNNKIRMISTSGIITTYAGTGVAGYSGDDAEAKQAKLEYPVAVASDSTGNIYIVEHMTHRIRRVSSIGIITTKVGGMQTAGSAGDGGLAREAQLFNPSGVCVDNNNGNLFIADSQNNKIRKVSALGIITTYAGTGTSGYGGNGGLATSATFSYPTGVAVNSLGTLFIVDRNNYVIRMVTSPNGIITTFAGTL